MIRNLRLARFADSHVGDNDTHGVLGAKRKRTAIAQELIDCPDILFLDEPMSSLDSSSAHTITETLRRNVDHSGHIVATINQPSWAQLSLFNKFILTRLGHKIPANQNSADFFMDLLTVDHSKTEEDVVKDLEHVASIKAAYKYRPHPAQALPGAPFSVINAAAATAAADAELPSKKQNAVCAAVAAAAAPSVEVETRAASISTIVATPAELRDEPELNLSFPFITTVDPHVRKNWLVPPTQSHLWTLRPATALPPACRPSPSSTGQLMVVRNSCMERTALETVRDGAYLVAGLARSIAVLTLIGTEIHGPPQDYDAEDSNNDDDRFLASFTDGKLAALGLHHGRLLRFIFLNLTHMRRPGEPARVATSHIVNSLNNHFKVTSLIRLADPDSHGTAAAPTNTAGSTPRPPPLPSLRPVAIHLGTRRLFFWIQTVAALAASDPTGEGGTADALKVRTDKAASNVERVAYLRSLPALHRRRRCQLAPPHPKITTTGAAGRDDGYDNVPPLPVLCSDAKIKQILKHGGGVCG
ncbi:ATP-binding cassette sub- G member 2 [Cladochytrium tenue]|nr:ATP-binding cassette sub- G member 2 [Cladochytrium tenue]